MKEFSKLKKYYEAKMAKKFCNLENIDKCTKKVCTCKLAAEVKTYQKLVLPDDPIDYSKCSILDFNGISKDNNEQVLDADIALVAKMQIVNFCWGIKDKNKWLKIENNRKVLSKKSIMDYRFTIGSHVVIYGDSINTTLDEKNEMIFKNRPIGKTLIAAIIMKEAIKRRACCHNLSQTYGWVSFTNLRHMLINNDDRVFHYKMADWLVIDDIILDVEASEKSQVLFSSVLDPFFQDRLEEKLPTILVFKFNIENDFLNMEKCLGLALMKIIRSKNTHKICLSNNLV